MLYIDRCENTMERKNYKTQNQVIMLLFLNLSQIDSGQKASSAFLRNTDKYVAEKILEELS